MTRLKKVLQLDILYYTLLILITLYALIVNEFVKYSSKYNVNENTFLLTITSFTIDGDKLSLELVEKEKLVGSYYFTKEEQINEFINDYSIGDVIKVKGTLNIPNENSIPNTFNYKKYLYNNRIYYTLSIEEFKLYKKSNSVLYYLKNYFYKSLYQSKSKDYLYTFLVGEKSYIDKEVLNSFSINGISHLFSLSGLHVNFLSAIIIKLLKKLNLKENACYIVSIFFLFILAFLSGFVPSIMRAILLFVLIYINKKVNLNIRTENIILIVYVILVLFNSFIIYDLGFQLSFTITYFLIICGNKTTGKGYVKQIIYISFISFISSYPIIVNNFYTINILSIFINVIFVPFISFVLYPLSLLTFLLPVIEPIFNGLCNIMENLSVFISKFNGFNIFVSKISTVLFVSHYIVLLLFIKRSKMIYLVLLIILMILNYFIPYLDKHTYLYFVDVGQGDCILIKTKYNRSTIMIDTGGVQSYKKETWQIRNNQYSSSSNIITFLKSIGVKSINYMFLTHGHEDHLGNANNIIKAINTKKVYINQGNINHYESNLIKKVIIDKNVFKIDNVTMYKLNNYYFNDENSDSIVFLVLINNKKILLMGDATKRSEEYILKEYEIGDIDVLKVGHHGSKTSSSEQFIRQIMPKHAIIMAGLNNKYMHPNIETLETLEKYHVNYRVTFNSKTIKYIFN